MDKKIYKEPTDSFNYVFDFDFDYTVVNFCRSLKIKYGYSSFRFIGKKWRFNNPEIIDEIKKQYPNVVIIGNMKDDLDMYEIKKKEKEKKRIKGVELQGATDSDIKIKNINGELYPYQKVGVEFFINNDGNAILGDTMGLGKQQSVDSNVMTPDGPKKIGDIVVGDNILTHDGTETKVVGIYPQGIKDVYEFTMRDGGKTMAGPDHLWAAYNSNDRRKNKNYKIITTKEIINSGIKEKSGESKWSIPFQGMMRFKKNKLSIDPYLLGVLIGDGCLLRSVIFSCSDTDIDISQKIKKIVEKDNYKFKKDNSSTCPRYRISNGRCGPKTTEIMKIIRSIGLNVKSKYKFIPKEYLYSDINDRKEILSGLMDTDGSCTNNRTTFSTTSKQLAIDIATLVRSLAGEAIIHTYDRANENKPIEYSVNIRVKFNPFYTKRKRERWSLMKNFNFKYRRIKDIKFVGKKECVCIAVDHPSHLYVTDDFIVTHNTLQALAFAAHSGFKKILVISPASVKYSWESEVLKWTKFKPYVIESQSEMTVDVINDYNVYIINYDLLKKFYKTLLPLHWDLAIVDEFHYIKNIKAQRTKYTMDIVKNVKSKLLLSGTPLLSRPVELFTGLKIMDSETWNDWFSYTAKYCDGHRGRFGWDANGHSNIKELRERISAYFIRRKKEEVLKELPPKTFIDFPVVLDDENKKNYDYAEQSFVDYLRDVKNKKIETDNFGATALVKLNELRQLATKGKVYIAEEIIDNIISNDEKIIVFSAYNEPLEYLKEKYKDNVCILTGKTKGEDRKKIVDDFQNKKHPQIFLGGIKSAGVGITLTAASNVLFIDYSWVPADHWQAVDRVHRIGQTANNITVYQLFSKGTIDEKMNEMLNEKQKLFEQIIEGKDIDQQQKTMVDDMVNHYSNK